MFPKLFIFALGILSLVNGAIMIFHPFSDIPVALGFVITVFTIVVGSMLFGWGLYCIIHEAVSDALKK